MITKLNDLRIRPSEITDDEHFPRRMMVDLIGVQPTPEEVLAFVADQDPNKREKIVETTMQRSEFVDWWSLKWGDLLQNSRNTSSDGNVYAFREWMRAAVARNMPLDEFARDILTARGSAMDNPAAGFYAASKDPDDTIQRVTEVFCGVRMLCARCHSHPFEHWTQADYYGLYSFFNQVSTKADPRQVGIPKCRKDYPDLTLDAPYSTNPRTGTRCSRRAISGGDEPKLDADVDRRQALLPVG